MDNEEHLDSVLYELESLTALFKGYRETKENFSVPLKCFKKVVNQKLKSIKESVKEL